MVTAGGLSGEGGWREPKHPRYLLPARPLGVIFRAKVRDALAQRGWLDGVAAKVWSKNWVVHCQHAGGGEEVLSYLSRYVHRVAISNNRIEKIENGQITFRYRDNKTGLLGRITLPAEEFIRRFLQHVLPRGFMKVRSYGLFSPASTARLQQARALLPPATIPTPHPELEKMGNAGRVSKTASTQQATDPQIVTPGSQVPIHRCPFCQQGPLVLIRAIPRKARSP